MALVSFVAATQTFAHQEHQHQVLGTVHFPVTCTPEAGRCARGAAIFRHACGLGLEGIVSKRIGSRYVSGRTRAWLKSKNPHFRRI
jgi:hypothetical protein